jgi:prepilin-type processing-associated H-X9-DG protein
MGLALHMNHDAAKKLPSGGWGWAWVGMPNRGTGPDQPGGWLYNILPYVEQGNLRNFGLGKTGAAYQADMVTLIGTPNKLFNCPARRNGGPYTANGYTYYSADAAGTTLTVVPTVAARTDYAANAGSQNANEYSGGPGNLATGDTTTGWYAPGTQFNGVIFQRSGVNFQQITRGTSNTYLVGEKYMNPNFYLTGQDPGDNEAIYVGMDNDINRCTASAPLQDTNNLTDTLRFGSSHSGGFYMLMCDGSVQFIEYSINLSVYQLAGKRDL